MFSYIIAFLACALALYSPVSQILSPGAQQQLRRTPRPHINEELLALEGVALANQTGHGCPADAYSVRVFSREPLVIYIENFLSPEERDHLLEIR